MFNTTIHKTENHDLAISNKEIYERKIDRLQGDLHKAATPENLKTGLDIAQEFEKNLIFKYCNSDNCFLEFIVVQTPANPHTLTVCFTINEDQLSFEISCKSMMKHKKPHEIMEEIRNGICRAISEALPIDQIIEAVFVK
jgi:hypothetical protein